MSRMLFWSLSTVYAQKPEISPSKAKHFCYCNLSFKFCLRKTPVNELEINIDKSAEKLTLEVLKVLKSKNVKKRRKSIKFFQKLVFLIRSSEHVACSFDNKLNVQKNLWLQRFINSFRKLFLLIFPLNTCSAVLATCKNFSRESEILSLKIRTKVNGYRFVQKHCYKGSSERTEMSLENTIFGLKIYLLC